MLKYLGGGWRDYVARPVWPYTRGAWEVQAFLKGGAGLLLEGGNAEPVRERVLYVCAPGCAHGWMGDGRESEVAVFHFDQVPDELAAVVDAAKGWVALELDDAAEDVLRRLLAEARRESAAPRTVSGLQFQRILIELSLEVLRLAQPPVESREKTKVDAIIAWYGAHLGAGATLVDAARAQAVSVAHARRLFHKVLGRSPQAVLAEVRFRRAATLVRETDLKLAEIGAAVGFSEASAFTRAFRDYFGVPPSAWR